MKSKELKKILSEKLSYRLKELGFNSTKKGGLFSKVYPNITQEFEFYITSYSQSWSIEGFISLRSKPFEKIIKKIYENPWGYSETIIDLSVSCLSIEDKTFFDKSCNIEDIVKEMLIMFEQTAIPFFSDFTDLEDIEKEFKDFDKRKYIIPRNTEDFVVKSLILNKMLDRANFDTLRERNLEIVRALNNEIKLNEIQAIIDRLVKYPTPLQQ
jgi:hypothetical protein